MSGKAGEADLSHGADDERFGRAMVKCEGYMPDCSYFGRCSMGGQCFASPPHIVAARLIEKLIPTDGSEGMHLSYLRAASDALRLRRIEP